MRGHPDFASLPVVIFTSSPREEDKARAKELGANEYIEKPSELAKLGDVVQRLRERWLVGLQC
jgi:CheY-like chemotaxis protein